MTPLTQRPVVVLHRVRDGGGASGRVPDALSEVMQMKRRIFIILPILFLVLAALFLSLGAVSRVGSTSIDLVTTDRCTICLTNGFVIISVASWAYSGDTTVAWSWEMPGCRAGVLTAPKAGGWRQWIVNLRDWLIALMFGAFAIPVYAINRRIKGRRRCNFPVVVP